MTLNFSIPKRQHRFLVGPNADDILATTGCIVELPSIEDASDQIVIRGPQTQLSNGLQAVRLASLAHFSDLSDGCWISLLQGCFVLTLAVPYRMNFYLRSSTRPTPSLSRRWI